MADPTEWLGTTDGDYQNAANWTNGVPIAGDNVYVKEGANDIDTNLNNSGVLLSSFHVELGYTGLIGNSTTFLQIQTPLLYLGTNPTGSNLNGSQRVNIDVGSLTACDITVENSNPGAADSGKTPVRLRAGHANGRLFVNGGLVSFSDDPADTSTLALIDASAGQLTVGENITLTDMNVRGTGQALLQSTLSGTLEILGGLLSSALAIAIPTVNVKGGEFISNASGLITTAVVTGGIIDFTQCNVPRTVTNFSLGSNAEVLADPGVITFTNNIVMQLGKPLRFSSTEAA